MYKFYEEIRDSLSSVKVLDTHEHLPQFENLRPDHKDFLCEYLSQYFKRDLLSAGMPQADFDFVTTPENEVMERWAKVEPYWELCRHTGYGIDLDLCAKGLYNEDGITKKTIESLTEKFKKTYYDGYFKHILREKCNIEKSLMVRDNIVCDKELFQIVPNVTYMTLPGTWADVLTLERMSGMRITSFNSWLEATEATLNKFLKEGNRILKCGLAYLRPLYFERTLKSAAEKGFAEIFSTKHYPDWEIKPFNCGKEFTDYMMHFILKFANKNGMVFQFHTGLLEGNGNIISNAEPTQLSNLFIEYPDIKFDLFHIAFPYQHTLSALGKMFPNVFLDMTWGHSISPTASINILAEWLDTMPVNKIMAFGGDRKFVDGVYGSLELAKRNIATSLARKVDEGIFDVDRAKYIGKILFYDNPKKLFNI